MQLSDLLQRNTWRLTQFYSPERIDSDLETPIKFTAYVAVCGNNRKLIQYELESARVSRVSPHDWHVVSQCR